MPKAILLVFSFFFFFFVVQMLMHEAKLHLYKFVRRLRNNVNMYYTILLSANESSNSLEGLFHQTIARVFPRSWNCTIIACKGHFSCTETINIPMLMVQ